MWKTKENQKYFGKKAVRMKIKSIIKQETKQNIHMYMDWKKQIHLT